MVTVWISACGSGSSSPNAFPIHLRTDYFLMRVALVEFTLLKAVMQQVESRDLLAIPLWVVSAPISSNSSHTIVR